MGWTHGVAVLIDECHIHEMRLLDDLRSEMKSKSG
jgi:hypothetical protein